MATPSQTVTIKVGAKDIHVAVTPALRAYFNSQISRPNPTPLQRKKYKTIMKLMEAAYCAGRDHG